MHGIGGEWIFFCYLCAVMIKLNGDMEFFWYYGKQLIGLYKNPFV